MDIVEYPTRADMVEALMKARADGIAVETIDGYHVLGFPEGSYSEEAPEGDETPGEDGEGEGDSEEPGEGDSEEDGTQDTEEPGEGDSEEPPNLAMMNRAQLRAVITDNALDIQVPDDGPLGPVRDEITEALGG